MVGMRGFEPPTPPTPRECADQAALHADYWASPLIQAERRNF